jgi:hypothetical protein
MQAKRAKARMQLPWANKPEITVRGRMQLQLDISPVKLGNAKNLLL